MDRNRKSLLKEIRALLRGPVPKQTIIYFDDKYILGELLKGANTQKEIPESRVKTILSENPDCKCHYFYLTHQNPPADITDDLEKYEWLREHKIEPDIPDILQGRINPPEGVIIGVTSRRCAESLINLFSGIKDRPNPTHSKEY